MEGNVIARSDLTEFKNYLRDRERSVRTIDKYCRMSLPLWAMPAPANALQRKW